MRELLVVSISNKPINFFISYASEDKYFCERLLAHLKVFERSGLFATFYDQMITAGEDRLGRISSELDNAEVIIFLLSADFLNSDYCWDVEMVKAFRKLASDQSIIIPVLTRAVAGLEYTPFHYLQYLPRNGVPIDQWSNEEEACSQLANEIKRLIRIDDGRLRSNAEKFMTWGLKLEGKISDFPIKRIKEVAIQLNTLVSEQSIIPLGCIDGSVTLCFLSKVNAYKEIERLHLDKALSGSLNLEIIEISRKIGARVKFNIHSIDNKAKASDLERLDAVDYNVVGELEDFEVLANKLRFPPIIRSMVLSYDNITSPGFTLWSDHHTKLTQDEILQLSTRLGRYMNTFLALESQYHYVDLSPTQDYAGLPEPLVRTELGRDLLYADYMLKRTTAQLLHPAEDPGKQFWEELERRGVQNYEGLNDVLRLWITPQKASINEQKIDDRTGEITLENFRLKVQCQRESISSMYLPSGNVIQNNDSNDLVIETFQEIILPEIQKQVDMGFHFGTLRQIFTVLILSSWLEEKIKIYNIPFINSNNTEPYWVEGIESEILNIHNKYLTLFEKGEWSYQRNRINPNLGKIEQQQIIIGGINFSMFEYK